MARAMGPTVHREAKLAEGNVVPGEQVPVPVLVEIVKGRSGGLFLYRYDSGGQCVADTWHRTLVGSERAGEVRVWDRGC